LGGFQDLSLFLNLNYFYSLMTRLSIPLLVVAAILLTSCDKLLHKMEKKNATEVATPSAKKNGVVENFNKQGKLMSKISYVNGKKHGLAISYYADGKVHSEITYNMNKKDGLAKMYFESGILFRETPYVEGKIHGVQKKYRRSGQLEAEVPFFEGYPTIGLKEYLLNGNLKTNYPTIVVTTRNELLKNDTYTLEVKLSDNSKRVKFYMGDLKNGYIQDWDLYRFTTDKAGVGRMVLEPSPGEFIMKQINIIAVINTTMGNEYITQMKYNLSVENPI
jgi:hypothetical protein